MTISEFVRRRSISNAAVHMDAEIELDDIPVLEHSRVVEVATVVGGHLIHGDLSRKGQLRALGADVGLGSIQDIHITDPGRQGFQSLAASFGVDAARLAILFQIDPHGLRMIPVAAPGTLP